MTRLRRHSGVWKDAERYRKHNGVWKPISERYRRVGSIWQQTYSSGFNPDTSPGAFVEEQGGYYLGVFNGFHLFMSPKELGNSPKLALKGWPGDSTAGTQSDSDGWANTNNMLPLSNHPAANWVKGLTIYGRDDFYIPSRNENIFMFNARNLVPAEERNNWDWYWSSTENPSGRAYMHLMQNGSESTNNKQTAYHVRAIRRVAV